MNRWKPISRQADAKAAKQFVLPPLHLKRGDPDAKIAAALHRSAARSKSAARNSFIWKAGRVCGAEEMDSMLAQFDAASERNAAGRRAHARLARAHRGGECRRMGGGFGGKESQSALFACVAALAAKLLRRPVKLRADHDDDFMITGKRHDAIYEYEAGFGNSGRILGARVEIGVARGLFRRIFQAPVATRAVCHFDNAYYLVRCRHRRALAARPTRSRTPRFAALADRKARS